jgi:hypothetical protein
MGKGLAAADGGAARVTRLRSDAGACWCMGQVATMCFLLKLNILLKQEQLKMINLTQ